MGGVFSLGIIFVGGVIFIGGMLEFFVEKSNGVVFVVVDNEEGEKYEQINFIDEVDESEEVLYEVCVKVLKFVFVDKLEGDEKVKFKSLWLIQGVGFL